MTSMKCTSKNYNLSVVELYSFVNHCKRIINDTHIIFNNESEVVNLNNVFKFRTGINIFTNVRTRTYERLDIRTEVISTSQLCCKVLKIFSHLRFLIKNNFFYNQNIKYLDIFYSLNSEIIHKIYFTR